VEQYGIPALALTVLLGVGLVLLAIQQRPVHPPVAVVPSSPDAVPAVPPSELAALGYVPENVHFLIGIHIAEAWRTQAGRRFLDGSGALGTDRLESLTGLKMADFDHAVLAVKLDQFLPRFFLIVRTIRPYNQGEIRNALKATKLASTDSRPLYEFTMQQPPLKAVLWFADDRTLLIGWPQTELKEKEVPIKPRAGLEHLPADVRSMLKDHLDPAARKAPAHVWLAGHVDNWEKIATQLVLAAQFKDAWPVLSKVKTLGVWAQLNEDADLHAVCHCADSTSAEALHEYLQAHDSGKGLTDLLPKNNALAAELSRTLKTTRDGESINLEAHASAASIQQALQPPK
jgi:hypothetical protein